ncbi:MAG: 5'/3'-nucleotidase SurE [Candidatus Acidiferrales bacterium]
MGHILLTNDDGIHSDGILALEEALQAAGAEVWVVAPHTEMSATSHAISLQRPVRVEALSERKFAVEGTPADSVIVALSKVLPVEPDLVISGINKGGNMGENVFYSGTLAAAFEAVLNHIPAFAISVASRKDFEFGVAAAFAVKLAEKMQREPLPVGLVLNVNVPCPWRNGVRLTRQSQKISKNMLAENVDPRGRKYFWIHEQLDLSQIAPDTDYAAIQAGSISVTPLRVDRTDEAALGQLERWAGALNQFVLAAE